MNRTSELHGIKKEWTKPNFERQSLAGALNATAGFGSDGGTGAAS